MNQDLALRVLGQIMNWTDDHAREEFQWLKLMARLKYDGYRDFQAGARFIENLVTWLQQFALPQREVAYALVRKELVYIGPAEMQHLVEQFYPRTVRERLTSTVCTSLSIPEYYALSNPTAAYEIDRLRRQTLFMGLSDGARLDIVRHANAGVLGNEQFVLATQVDKEKWEDLLENLRSDLKDTTAQFKLIYLLDDFVATGTSFLRFNEKKKKWSGKLTRFRDSVANLAEARAALAPDWLLCVHHYLGSSSAADFLKIRSLEARTALQNDGWSGEIFFSFGLTFPAGFPINLESRGLSEFIQLTDTYYDPILRTKHTDVGGVEHLGLGYGGCALPLILEHNTPNNSIALLWADTEGGQRDGAVSAPAMKPLFRRRQRHS